MLETGRLKTQRTSIRLSLQFSLLYAVLSAVVFGLAYWFTQFEVKDSVVDQMIGDAETLAAIYESDGAEALILRVDALSQVSFENTRVYQLLNYDGEVFAGNIVDPMLHTPRSYVPAESLNMSSPLLDEVEGYWMRVDDIGPFRLVQGSGNHLIEEILEGLATALVLGFLVVIVLGLIVGVRVGRFTELRISDIASTLSRVSQGQLDARIKPSSATVDDLSRVSVEINTMLDQVKRLLESQAQISNDIAHDMRTPLQRLRQRLEALSQRDEVQASEVASSLEQTEEIIATFNALLRIAQIEAVNKKERFEEADLGVIVSSVAEIFEPIAEDSKMSLKVRVDDKVARIFGDPELLTQLIVNLVENSIKHCPPNTSIEIALGSSDAETVLSVSDDGPGIEPEIRAKVFQRFFRAESSRNSPGNGLGLALVKAIVDIHDAKIEIMGNNPGAIFSIRFPSQPG